MVIYSVITLLAAALLAGFGLAIYRGKTELIHDYHRKNVADKPAYAKAFGRSLLLMSLGPLAAGILPFFSSSRPIFPVSLTLLFTGLILGVVLLISVQKKYNKTIF